MRNKQFDIIGIGRSCVDHLMIVPRFPEFNQKIELLDYRCDGGGQVATALVTLARLGARTAFIGKMGDDALGKFMIDKLRQENVDTSNIIIQQGAASPVAFIMIDKSTGKRTIIYQGPQTSPITRSELDKNFLTSTKYLLVDPQETSAGIIAAGWVKPPAGRRGRSGVGIIYDAERNLPHIRRMIKLTDYLIASQSFLGEYSFRDSRTPCLTAGRLQNTLSRRLKPAATVFQRSHNLKDTGLRLLTKGPKVVVITQGEKGAIAITKNKMKRYPAFKVKIKDTTGAGDAFHGGFIYGLLQGWKLERIMTFSNAVAALSCRQIGGRSGLPDLKETLRFINNRI